jgi:hypothetical protein
MMVLMGLVMESLCAYYHVHRLQRAALLIDDEHRPWLVR